MGKANPLLRRRVDTPEQALARMAEIQDYLIGTQAGGERDGVACFNFVYHRITERVLESGRKARDGTFLMVLDVVFANRYFDALRAGARKLDSMPDSWRVLAKRRDDRDIADILFAVAGVNAHVNFDLPAAVVQTCERLGTAPDSGRQRQDYLLVNRIFAEEMEEVRQHFLDRTRELDDRYLAPVLNAVGNFSLVEARNAAWSNAQLLWTLRGLSFARRRFLARLDNLVGLAGHLILTPVPGLSEVL